MNKAKKISAVVLSGMLLASAMPYSARAAGAEVEDLNGIPTVYLSSFGRLSYNGANHTAFRDLSDAVAALGEAGGQIVFTGTVDMAKFSDSVGRAPLTFIGSGSKATASMLVYDENFTAVELNGDTHFQNCVIKTAENVPIHTNGYNVSLSEKANSASTETFVQGGDNIITYTAPFIFSNGKANGVGKLSYGSGVGKAVIGGAYGEEVLLGDTETEISGGTLDGVYVGNYNATGQFKGSSQVTVSGGDIQYALLGSDGGTTEGNLTLTVTGGFIKRMRLGAAKDSTVNGNVVLENLGGSIDTVITSKETVNGNVIVIDATGSLSISESGYDYYLRADGATVEPVFDGTTLKGFHIYDKNGFIPEKVMADGVEITHTNGIFTLNKGKNVITVTEAAALTPNRDATFVAGYADGTFRPSNNLTRAEAVTLLSRVLCTDISVLPSIASSDYTDVAPSDWYYGTISFFSRLGFLDKLEGDGGKTVSPNAAITRGEFAELCVNTLSSLYNGKKFGVKIFSDVPVTNPYYSAVGQLGYLGVSVGYEDGTFRPSNTITRAEVVTMVNRLLGRTPTGNGGAATLSDIEGHWAKDQIVAACNPQFVGETEIFTVTEDISAGSYTLLDGATIGEQIRTLREKIPTMAEKDVTAGIDAITNWQIKNILNAPDIADKEGGTTYYISPNGDDKNDGLSPETAWGSLKKLQTMATAKLLEPGDTVRFERGGTYKGILVCRPGVTYSAYGTGAKPVLSGSSKNYASEELWEETDVKDVYRLTDTMYNAGIMVFDYTGIVGNYNELVGDMRLKGLNGFNTYKDLYEDLTFYSDLSENTVYLCSKEGNPGKRFKTIDIGTVANLIQPADDVTIDNLTCRFVGAHGVGAGTIKNVTVQNCTFDYLGGSVLAGFGGGNITRYGNAIQLYGGCEGWYVYNNWCYQIYDTGITHQYNSYDSKGSCRMDDVRYSGNVVELCHWSIEYYNPDYTGTTHTMNNVYIADNICRLNGYGWGSRIRRGSANLVQSVGIPDTASNILMENNIYDRSTGSLFYTNSTGDRALQLKDNLYVQNAGGLVGTMFGYKVIASPTAEQTLSKSIKDNSILLQNDNASIVNYPG